MKSILAIVFICALAVSAYGAASHRNLKSAKNPLVDSLIELDGHHFGNTVLNAITVQLQTGGALEDVYTIINDLVRELQDETLNAGKAHDDVSAACEDDLDRINGEILNDGSKIHEQEDVISTLESDLENANNDLDDQKAKLADIQNNIETGQSNRDTEHQEYVDKQQDNQDATEAINEAIALMVPLSQGSGSASFIEQGKLKSINKRIQTLLEKKTHLKSEYAPFIMSLAELASNDNPGLISQILGLMNNLKKALAQEDEEDDKVEDQRAADWETLLGDYRKDEDSTEGEISRLNTYIIRLTDDLDVANTDLAAFQEQLAAHEKELAAMSNYCDEENANFTNAETARESLLSAVLKIKDFFDNNVASLKEYIMNRINS